VRTTRGDDLAAQRSSPPVSATQRVDRCAEEDRGKDRDGKHGPQGLARVSGEEDGCGHNAAVDDGPHGRLQFLGMSANGAL
jgi:hypothetical protein